MTYQAKVISGGKIVIPAEIRRELGIKDGDSLTVDRDDAGNVTIRTFSQIVREQQAKFRAAVGPDYSVDQFISDRAIDWPDE